MRISASFHHDSRRDNLSSDTARQTIRKRLQAHKPTIIAPPGQASTCPPGATRGTKPAASCGAYAQVAQVFGTHRPKTGPSPIDRAPPGSKHHVISEAHGIPLAVSLTGGNRNDVTQLMPLLQAIPPVRGRRGRPRQRPDALYADCGHDHDKYRHLARARGITPVIARRGTDHGSGLGTYRWVIEQSIALLHWFRRLRIYWEIRDDIHEAFLSLACAIICWRRLRNLSLC
jgi:transposase